jgi:hypothetical protein
LTEDRHQQTTQVDGLVTGEIPGEDPIHPLHSREKPFKLGLSFVGQKEDIPSLVLSMTIADDEAAPFETPNEIGDRRTVEVEFLANESLAAAGHLM